jgi:hypothetical protein
LYLKAWKYDIMKRFENLNECVLQNPPAHARPIFLINKDFMNFPSISQKLFNCLEVLTSPFRVPIFPPLPDAKDYEFKGKAPF